MLAFVFPGQGSQTVGMGRDLCAAYACSRDAFREADEVLGLPLGRTCFEGPESELQLTAMAQPAILTASVAAWRALSEEGVRPQAVAGHSLGEYSALVAAGALAFDRALVLVRKRGLYMQEAVPVGLGAMAAIMGLGEHVIDEVCQEASRPLRGEDRTQGVAEELVGAANLNAPGQIVISGHAAAVERAIAIAQQRGAKRAVKLAVSAPFHCPLMRPAAERLAPDLDAAAFADLSVPLVTNVDAAPIRTGREARESLKRQVTAPVLWEKSVSTLADMGITRALEVGPGRVLYGLIKRIDPRIECVAAGEAEAIVKLREVVR